MNEAETRAELIDPERKESGWEIVEGAKIIREYPITAVKIQRSAGGRVAIKNLLLIKQQAERFSGICFVQIH